MQLYLAHLTVPELVAGLGLFLLGACLGALLLARLRDARELDRE